MLSRILYEDKDIIVAYKPAGLPVQTARVGQPDMVSELKNHLCRARDGKDTSAGRGEPYLGIVHRLDQPVGDSASGITPLSAVGPQPGKGGWRTICISRR